MTQHGSTLPQITAGERVRSHEEIRARAASAAEGFRGRGTGLGDAVALCLRNDFAFFEAALGASAAGAFPVPMNWHVTADEASYILRDCGAKALVVHADLLPAIAAGLPEGLLVLVVDTPAEIRRAYRLADGPVADDGRAKWEPWLAALPPIERVATESRSAVVYTSGTTGNPKGVRRAPSGGTVALEIAALGYGLRSDGEMTVLMNGPMYHSAPNSYGMIAFNAGAQIVLQPRFDAEEMLALIERHRVTHMHIVPTMFVRLLRLREAVKRRYDLGSLQAVVHGAAPCPPEIKHAMIEWWGPVIREYYGSTETGLITAHDSKEALANPGTVGRTLPGVMVKILGEDRRELPTGEAGDIYVHSIAASNFEYIGIGRSHELIDGADFVTLGDIGYLNEDGYLFICDRRRDMIISGGVNIYPAEIEKVILTLDGVADCAVFGIPDDEFGEAVCAYVQPSRKGELDAEDIGAALRMKLSRFKLPRRIEFVDELPREDSGKVFKRKLREPYWAGRARTI
ncbi:MAG: AMP-binding protein [Candidatus Eremiobacteraeota bacterium]|nr:AMP-binding protein [Candidatus Eremiobacteraeota bacterium]